MAPPGRPPPDDLIPDILVHLAPDDPAGIIRAAAVCKSWRRILADPAFAARYRALHPSPPVLGFLHRPVGLRVARFVPTPATSFRPSPSAVQRSRHPLDCRHGRALFYDYDFHSTAGFVVWDPVTGDHHNVPEASDPWTQLAVLCGCASAGCGNHRACGGGGAFIVAVAGVEDTGDGYSDFHASLYSSDTGRWSMDLYIHLGHKARCGLVEDRPAALVGDSLYFVTESGGLLRYRYGLVHRLGNEGFLRPGGYREADVLSVVEPPPPGKKRFGNVFAMAAEDGGIGLASLYKNSGRLYLWGREATAGGRWVQRRVIDLREMLPVGNNPSRRPRLSGVAEDGSAIFVSTDDGVFTVGLTGSSSSQARKVSEVGNVDVLYPFMSFYTESLLLKLASGEIAVPVGDH
ncbi:unnamed protein product [Urochloa decumbens]|uniref:F-box domain-containing protein n=1 Tax=Urochloa decumbens TaxID=240449 RepID=A0ABC9D6A3_9POAL